MPTLLDADQQAAANEDTSSIATALGNSGSAVPKDVPQSDSRVIAERLLGPEMTERYGDVLGIRKGTWKDFWRDAGNEIGRSGNADRVKERVIDQYNQKYRQERQDAEQKDQENRLKIQSYVDLVRSMKDTPKKFRTAVFKEGLEKLGMAASPTVLKMLSDPEEFNAEEILTPEMVEMLQEDSAAGLQQLEQVGMDPQAAVALKKGIQQMRRTKEETQALILRNERNRAGIEQTRARTDLIKARTAQIKAGKAGGASKTPLLDKLRGAPAAGAPQVTVRKKEPAGIPQPAAVPAGE